MSCGTGPEYGGPGPATMPHGYTHRTTRVGSVITKAYRGPWAQAGCARETAALTALAGRLPVPEVVAAGPDWLRTKLMPGVHGQDLIAAGLAGPVLEACGRMLRQIHALPIPHVLVAGQRGSAAPAPADETAVVLVHGDFGPNNVLLDDRARAVTAVLDWEWAQAGDAVEDLAWTEFIVRLHHPADVSALDDFYRGYGTRAPWPSVQHTILRRCRSLLELCQGWQPDGPAVRAWAERIEIARSWSE
jgi:aminoglycoside phosphotransferase